MKETDRGTWFADIIPRIYMYIYACKFMNICLFYFFFLFGILWRERKKNKMPILNVHDFTKKFRSQP